MPRIARVVIADVAHHVTQGGNGRQFLLSSDTERLVYLDLLRQVLKERQLSILGYCLMSNHVLWVVTPRQAEDLAWTFQQVHGRYAAYWNAAHAACGHVWQGRFYSCPMDASQLRTALRYVELNPVRAGMVKEALGWRWSSSAGHCGTAEPEAWLEMTTWRGRWCEASWRRFLTEGDAAAERRAIRRCTQTGQPLGSREFTRALEERTGGRLAPRQRGRPRKITQIPAAATLRS